MKNSSQSPAGFNIVNFSSQLEKIKKRRSGPELQRLGGVCRRRQWLGRIDTTNAGLFLKSRDRSRR